MNSYTSFSAALQDLTQKRISAHETVPCSDTAMDVYQYVNSDLDLAETVEIQDDGETDVPCEADDAAQSIVLIRETAPATIPTSDESLVAIIDLTTSLAVTNQEVLHETSDCLAEILEEANISVTQKFSSQSYVPNSSKKGDVNQKSDTIDSDSIDRDNYNAFDGDQNISSANKEIRITKNEYLNAPSPITKDYPKFDAEMAAANFQDICDLGILLDTERRVLQQPMDVLCHQDEDGDTPLMIVVSKRQGDSQFSRFHENLFALQERILGTRICCGELIAEYELSCSMCGRSDPQNHHSPLSLKNKMGDSALTCAMKMKHSAIVIDYLLSGISRNENDIKRIFDKKAIQFYKKYTQYYPSLMEVIRQLLNIYENKKNL